MPSESSSAGLALAAGVLLAGRYRVVRLVARGGMGEVYEAEDLELGGRVALKTLHAHRASDPARAERLRRELQLARKVTHPNVCRIFDLGNHEGLLFLTMELLEGETLAERLRRTGRMSPEQVLPFARQMARALAAAHAVGIVHRDFKPANVLLVPEQAANHELSTGSSEQRASSGEHKAEGGGQRPATRAHGEASESPLATARWPQPAGHSPPATSAERLVVTDFGLARRSDELPAAAEEDDEEAPTDGNPNNVASALTGTGVMLGTPAYMAPEQIEGGPLGPAADVYALGIVLYEMLTGRRPFEADTPMGTLLRRLRQPPEPPSTFAPGLDRRWQDAVLRCLKREPAERFQSAAELLAALERAARARPSRRGRRWMAAALAAVLATGGAAWLSLRSEHTQVPAGRRSIAVLGFKNLSGDPSTRWLSTALAEMLGTELAAAGSGGSSALRVVSGESVARSKLELALDDADSYAQDTLRRIHRNLGVDLVVMGSYVSIGGGPDTLIRLDLRLQDAIEGETVLALSDSGTGDRLFDLVARTGERLRERLGVSGRALEAGRLVRAALPLDPEAARLYAEGLQKLRAFDGREALQRLERAVAIEPMHPLLHGALASASSMLGHDERALQEARLAFEQSDRLPDEARLELEALYRAANGELERAIELYRVLFVRVPENLDFGLQLALRQREARRPQDALQTVAELRRLPPPARDDARIDIQEAWAAYNLAEYLRASELAARATHKARAGGLRLQLAEARRAAGWALNRLGQLDAADAAFEEAHALYSGAGDRLSAGLALQGRGGVMLAQGRLAEARAMNERYLAVLREIGCRTCEPGALVNLAAVLEMQGQLEAARAMYGEALALRRETGDELGELRGRLAIATVSLKQGDLTAAASMAQELPEAFERFRDRASAGRTQLLLAQRSLAAGELTEARAQAAEALEGLSQISHKGAAAQARLTLAALALEEGDAATAAGLAQESLLQVSGARLPDEEVTARALLAHAFVLQGRTFEARGQAAAATGLLAHGENVGVRLRALVHLARVRAASPEATERARAAAELRAGLAEAVVAGFGLYQLELRLALAELGEPQAGDPEALHAEALAGGHGLVARKAAALEAP
jgi:eukaryotic-like serine/threonine-protein kinase